MTTRKKATKPAAKPAAPYTHRPFFAWTHCDAKPRIDPTDDYNSVSVELCKQSAEAELDPSDEDSQPTTVDVWEVRHVGKFEIDTKTVRTWTQK